MDLFKTLYNKTAREKIEEIQKEIEDKYLNEIKTI
tara:strand:- start:427 stop:531 length:105 start_codon:yes stop_codon:yes gene_type:complete